MTSLPALDYPRASAFLAEVRSATRALKPGQVLAIVEGVSDRAALMPHFAGEVVLKAAKGREKLLSAYFGLESSLRSPVVFIFDCDGNTPLELKGQVDLVISSNRDMEADLIFDLNAFHGVTQDYLGRIYEDTAVVRAHTEAAVEQASEMSTDLGLILKGAKAMGLTTHIKRPRAGIDRVITVTDVNDAAFDFSSRRPSDLSTLSQAVGTVLGWGQLDIEEISKRANSEYETHCARHETVCGRCRKRQLANGHHLVDALSLILDRVHGQIVSPSLVASGLRMSPSPLALKSWVVLRRLKAWEDASGMRVLR